MRTLFIMVLLGSLQEIRAQENLGSISTNSAGVVTRVRYLKPLDSSARTDPVRRTVPKGERPEDAKYVTLSLSFDAKARPVGVYDRAVIADVKKRWCDLLDNLKYEGSSTGNVVLQFQLNCDGRIAGLKLVENNMEDRLSLPCVKALLDQSPFSRWPKEMHKMIGADDRTMTLTFSYLPNEAQRKK